jgi:HAD superfamily hydrolase (TIGR01549 family)
VQQNRRSAPAEESEAAPRPRALLFDMDGTLTEPVIDFVALKTEMGIALERPILEALADMPADARRMAEEVLHRHEEIAATGSRLNPGCDELIEWVRSRRMPTALITRNSRRSAACVLERHGLSFDVLITREDGKFKPDPAPLLHACERLGVAPRQAWMIGDGSHDVHAGINAGVPTVWISHGRERDFPGVPWQTVPGLRELLAVLQRSGDDRVW